MIPTKILMFMMMSELMDSLLGQCALRCFFNDIQKKYMPTFLCSKADV